MKKTLVLLPVVAILAACGSTQPPQAVTNNGNVIVGMTQDQYERRADAERMRKSFDVEKSINQAPDWMSHLPNSNNAVFENGTAVSADWSMADHKAKAIAYGKICMAAGGTASQNTKIYNRDTEKGSQEYSEMAMKTACKQVDLTGVEVKEIKHVAEGNRFRTYVLVALPTGDANVLKRAKREEQENLSTEDRANKAFKELDEGLSPGEEVISTPKSKVVGVVAPDGSKGTLQLMDVDNADYKARREAALQKPGAVVGQTTIQN
jgi:hypothetical protein